MLKKFSVSNFKCFETEISFDLVSNKGYIFNPNCVKNGVVNNCMIYGHNGCGKSNLGLAIFDIIEHLWEVSPEVRYYFSESNRFYVGAQYKIGHFNYKLSSTGKQGDLQGGGLTVGCKLSLGKHFALDFNAAAGCLHTDYETYQVIDGVRVKDGDRTKNAWGLTDLGITLVWKLN